MIKILIKILFKTARKVDMLEYEINEMRGYDYDSGWKPNFEEEIKKDLKDK